MKLSKSLLKAMVVGAAVVGTTSCTWLADQTQVDDPIVEQCETMNVKHEKGEESPEHDPFDCPACGMG